MSLEALNEKVSYVSQEQFLFNTTLRESIRMGRPDATDAQVEEAAERAQCAEFLTRPGGRAARASDREVRGG